MWLKEIVDPELFDYNSGLWPFEDMDEDDMPHTLICSSEHPFFQKVPASLPDITLPPSTATLVVAMDLAHMGRIPGKDISYPLTLCEPEVCSSGKGDMVQVIVEKDVVSLLVRFKEEVIKRPVGTVKLG